MVKICNYFAVHYPLPTFMNKIQKIKRISQAILALFVVWYAFNLQRIYQFSKQYSDRASDVAIVLGAGTDNGILSPVFRERVNHSIHLFKEGKVSYILLTGGFGKNQKISDSRAAVDYALSQGIPEEKILYEEESTITYINLTHAQSLMQQHNLTTALIVSDPLHMMRSLKICNKIGLKGESSPTPSTMYKTWKPKLKSLLYEAFYYNMDLLAGHV